MSPRLVLLALALGLLLLALAGWTLRALRRPSRSLLVSSRS